MTIANHAVRKSRWKNCDGTIEKMKARLLSARIDTAVILPWLGRLAAVVMLGLLGWLGAGIYWTLSAPESVRAGAQMETDLQKAQQAVAGRHLFGVYVVASATSSVSDIRLNGAIAGQKPGQRAYALLSIEGKPSQLVREGEELAPGIKLQRVEARQVELLRGGQSQTLTLPENSKPPTDAGKALPAPPPPAPAPEPPKAAAEPVPAAAAAIVVPASPKAATVTSAVPPSAPPLPRRSRPRRSTEDDS